MFSINTNLIRVRLFAAFLLVTGLAVVGAIVATVALGGASKQVSIIADRRLPEMEQAYDFALAGRALESQLKSLVGAQSSSEIEALAGPMGEASSALDQAVLQIEKTAVADTASRLSSTVADLHRLTETLKTRVGDRLSFEQALAADFEKASQLKTALSASLEEQIDQADELAIESLLRILMAANQITVHYAEAIASENADHVRELSNGMRSVMSELKSNIAILGSDLPEADRSNAMSLLAFAEGEKTLFDRRIEAINLSAATEAAVESVETRQEDLAAQVASLVQATREEVRSAGVATKSSIGAWRLLQGLIVVGCVIVSLLTLWLYIARNVIRRLSLTAEVTHSIAGGDFERALPEDASGDELAELMSAVRILREHGIERKRLEATQSAERESRERRTARLENLISTFDNSVNAVLDTMTNSSTTMSDAAKSMTRSAGSSAEQSSEVAAASEDATRKIELVAAAAEELLASISEIATLMQDAAQAAEEAVIEVSTADRDAVRLAGASERVGNIVDLINNIASQTNLLALNATIEAARAGEAGRGFAVVASEVKALANQTSEATSTIVGHIEEIRGISDSTVKATRSIGETIARLKEIANSVAGSIDQQRAATEEIARNSQEVAGGTRDVNERISAVDAATSETGAEAQNVLQCSEEIAKQCSSIRTDVSRFFADVRAA